VPARFVALGTDGFGRSDVRESLRAYFEIDAASIAAAAMSALAAEGTITGAVAAKAISDLGVDPEKANPQYE
jgi:pyruvate dehydrogenase E1 component